MAYATQLSNGEVRLFNSKAQAEACEKKLPEGVCIVGGIDVNAADHYRGKIPAAGVRFTKEDQSHGQLLAAMMYAEAK